MSTDNKRTVEILKKIADRYKLPALQKILDKPDSILFEKDIFVSLDNIVAAVDKGGDVLSNLKEAKNVYNAPIFSLKEGGFLLKNIPDFDKSIEDMAQYEYCFKLSPYQIINTYLAVIESSVAGIDINLLYKRSLEHIEASISCSLQSNPKTPLLLIPVGAAGCGKSTFYRELSNAVNISCDNIRYLLFRDYGPCFSSWESCLSWWMVNRLTDHYIEKGYTVFYNGVNTDLEYRTPVTMENPDPLYAGIPYTVKIIYFEPPVKLSDDELKELKSINLWAEDIDKLDTSAISSPVKKILDLVKENHARTLERTKEITSGRAEQDPFDVLYAVPLPVVKLFVEQSFDRPSGENVVFIPRRDIPDAGERSAFYRKYADL